MAIHAHWRFKCTHCTSILFNMIIKRPLMVYSKGVNKTISRLRRTFWINAHGFLSWNSRWIFHKYTPKVIGKLAREAVGPHKVLGDLGACQCVGIQQSFPVIWRIISWIITNFRVVVSFNLLYNFAIILFNFLLANWYLKIAKIQRMISSSNKSMP